MGKEDLLLRFKFGVFGRTFLILEYQLDCLLIADTMRGIVKTRTHIAGSCRKSSWDA